MGRKGGEKECFTRLTEGSLCHMYIYGFSYSHFASRIGIFGPGYANSRSLLIYHFFDFSARGMERLGSMGELFHVLW